MYVLKACKFPPKKYFVDLLLFHLLKSTRILVIIKM